MALGYSFDDQTDEKNQNPQAPPPPAATPPPALGPAGPVANMGGAPSPGLGSQFDQVFGGNATSISPSAGGDVAKAAADVSTDQNKMAASSPADPWGSVADHQLSGAAASQKATAVAPSGGTATGGSSDIASQFKELTSQLSSATDPQQKAVLQDKLSRQVFSSLKDAGHDVKWQGDQLMVDGRAYVVGPGIAPGEGNPNAPGSAPPLDQPHPGAYQTNLMEGDPGKLADPARAATDPKYGFLQLAQQNKYDYTQMPQMLDELKAGPGAKLWQGWQADGKGNFVFAGNPAQLDPAWKGVTRVDAVGAFGNIANGGKAAGWRWGVDGPNGGAGGGQLSGGDLQSYYDNILGAGGGTAPGAANVTVNTGAGGGSAAPPAAPTSTAPVYTPPGKFDNKDLAGTGIDDILNKIGPTPTPGALPTDYKAGSVSNDPLSAYSFSGLGDLGQLGAGKTDAQTEDLVSRILQHPESMDPRTVEMLKAKSKDELAAMQQSDAENLRSAGFATGNQDSNWLQSEELAAKGRRDNALVSSNRNIDMTAATTNAEDRRQAAAVGQSYGNSKALNQRADAAEKLAEKQAAEGDQQAAAQSRQQAAEFRRQGEVANESMRSEAADRNLKASQQNIDNQFKSAEEKRAAVALGADTQLKAASMKQDRVALEESFKQKASELGQSADKLRQDYALAQMDDLTRRYGIDVGASIDRAKLAAAGTQFQQDLIFRIMALKQAHDEFGATYGLDVTKTAHTIDQDMWNRTFGK